MDTEQPDYERLAEQAWYSAMAHVDLANQTGGPAAIDYSSFNRAELTSLVGKDIPNCTAWRLKRAEEERGAQEFLRITLRLNAQLAMLGEKRGTNPRRVSETSISLANYFLDN